MRTELINAYITIYNEVENLAFHGITDKHKNAVSAKDGIWAMLTRDEKVRANETLLGMEVRR